MPKYNSGPYTLLDAVTTATTGSALSTKNVEKATVTVNITVNTGAVTITIEGSQDGTNWVTINAATSTSVEIYDVPVTTHYKSIRAKTTVQSNSTVTVTASLWG